MSRNRQQCIPQARLQAGVSLIELMIALVLGLIVVAGAGAMFLSNKRVYGTSETLNRIQENERVSFELMSRDLREAGGDPCGSQGEPVNLLKQATAMNGWWNSFNEGLRGYGGSDALPGTTSGTGVAQRITRTTGNDAIDLHIALDGDIRVVSDDNPSAVIDVSSNANVKAGDIVMICNSDEKMIFQVTHLASNKIGMNAGGGTTGNCSKLFQKIKNVSECKRAPPKADVYCFRSERAKVHRHCGTMGQSPAQIAKIGTARWYLGNNARGGTSLYRAEVVNSGAGAAPNVVNPEEIAEGATGMNVTYLRTRQADFVPAATITADNAWGEVVAVRVEIEFEGADGALRGSYVQGTDGQRLRRSVTNVVALRNREDML